MTALTMFGRPAASTATEAPAAPVRLGDRVRREVYAHLAVAAGVVSFLAFARVMAAVAPWHVWWPIVTGLVLETVLMVTAPRDSTSVMHGIRSAWDRPKLAAAAIAVVCLPWLGGWALDALHAIWNMLLTAIASGVSDGIRRAVTGASSNLPSVPGLGQLAGTVTSHLPGSH